jgi:hypothetical protein
VKHGLPTSRSDREWISVDGHNGCVYLGGRDVAIERPDAELGEFERWRAAAETGSR